MREVQWHEKGAVTWERCSDMREVQWHERGAVTRERCSDMRKVQWHEKGAVTWERCSDMRKVQWHEKGAVTWWHEKCAASRSCSEYILLWRHPAVTCERCRYWLSILVLELLLEVRCKRLFLTFIAYLALSQMSLQVARVKINCFLQVACSVNNEGVSHAIIWTAHMHSSI